MSSSIHSLVTATLLSIASVHAFDYPIEVSSPTDLPAGASWVVPHDFCSFSFPAHWFSDFSGNDTHPNLFSRDIFDLLYSKTGAHPFIRVGGTSTDRVWYNSSQEVDSFNEFGGELTAEYGIPDRVNVGPSFFGGFENFPGSHWSWQLNMGNTFGKPGGLENALEVAQIVMDTVKDKLESFELGNEPDLMVRLFGHRPQGYNLEDYVQEWKSYAAAASEHVLKGNKYGLEETRFFQAMTIAGGDEEDWALERAFGLGIDDGGHVKSIAYHQYAAGGEEWVRLQNSYMNHTANAANISQYADEIALSTSYDPSLPFVLGETNSNSKNLNMSQIEGVFGSALWMIDHFLLGMAANMTRYNMIQGTTFGYSGWVPVPFEGRDPHVRAPLYGHIFASEVLGHHPEVQVYEIPELPWNMSAYGIYESGTLAKYVVVNYDEWNATTTYERPVQDVILDIPRWADHVNVYRLTGAGASADEGIEWAGQSWNYTDGRLVQTGSQRFDVVSAVNGTVALELPSTEAMLVTLGRGACNK